MNTLDFFVYLHALSLIPEMSILSPGDANEASELLKLTPDWPGSIYIRLAKYGKPNIWT